MVEQVLTMKRTVASALMLSCFCLGAAAQQKITVKGNIVDGSGESLIGATVKVKGNPSLGAVTDMDGNFIISVPSESSTLVITYVGMDTKEIKVGKKREFKITLSDDNSIGEVVVVGYGQQKKASVVGSITQTTGKQLERAGGVSSIGAALTGNLPGVITMSSTGMPGDEDPKIVIRGISSWNSSDPLVLVDGVERPMSSIDISSVQSISVLKDASATAVYGVKGANGVILITTKRGTEGKAKIEAGVNMTLKSVSKLPGSLGSADALYIRNQALEHELGLTPQSWNKMSPAAVIEKYRHPANLEERERYPDVDWADELFRTTGFAYNPNLNISGGTKYVTYFAAIDFLHEGDMFKNWDNGRGYSGGYGYNRVNTRSNLDFKLTNTTKLKVNLFGSYGAKLSPWGISDTSWAATQLWQAAYSAPHDVFYPRYSDGTWGYYPTDTQGAPNSVTNLALAGRETTTTTRINTDFTLEQDLGFLLKGLKASATVSWDNVFVEAERGIDDRYHDAQFKWIDPDTGKTTYLKPDDTHTNFDFQEGIKWSTQGGKVNNDFTQRNLFYQGQLFWGNKFGKHDVTAMGVFNRTERAIGSQFTNYREDWAFRATYNYAGKYFFEYNGAYNGSEKFSKENRFAFFNSGAIGWTVTEENFMKQLRDKHIVDLLKLRFSYGEVGDDNINDRWLYTDQWAYGGNTFQGLDYEKSPYTWYRQTRVGNPDIHWEKAVKRNFGIDYGFLGGLFTGSLEFFHEDRSDILIAGGSRAIPSYYGASAPTLNYGKVKTNGYELELKVNKILANGLRLWGNFNMTHAENKVKLFDDPKLTPAYQKTTGFAIGQDHSYLDAGYANTWDDVYAMTKFNTNNNQKLPGDYFIIDYNGDGVIDTNDNVPYGHTGTPANTYSASIGADYKGFSFYVQFYGVTDVDRYVAFSTFHGKLDTVFDEGSYWSKDNEGADAPMPRFYSTPSYTEGTRYHYDGSFIRLKNAEIAYTWTGGWIKSLGLNTLKVFINGNNLWCWSRMPDDRESNFAGTGLASQGAYPTVKRYNFGVKFTL